MKTDLIQDHMGTHISWEHDGVTPKMIDWFWSNMEKGFILWHPEQHEPLEWAVAPKHGNPVGSIHIAPQTWNDGTRQNLYIRIEELKDVPEAVKEYIVYEHCVIVAGLGLGEESMVNPDPMGYRIHQWQKSDIGVIGKSSAIGTRKKETKEEGITWSAHCIEEIGNWGVFLPTLYELYKVVTNTKYNLYANLSVEGKGKDLKYKYIK
ncbi:hypothetical protein GC105_02915 [Alkalibaculum sp. M08DMB]|uniref:DAPG hydrolase PhiG domain-containing protein n=1 Tax=Alkalibaculum sporogenes TaxID=2655001 RepID=A0A6A7K5X8_9FIRM|nr:hypothetical protein [Alkalibaculum sporogenes]MPW24741.1 hypothetical protein [Alkalibaculum sporogenes]